MISKRLFSAIVAVPLLLGTVCGSVFALTVAERGECIGKACRGATRTSCQLCVEQHCDKSFPAGSQDSRDCAAAGKAKCPASTSSAFGASTDSTSYAVACPAIDPDEEF